MPHTYLFGLGITQDIGERGGLRLKKLPVASTSQSAEEQRGGMDPNNNALRAPLGLGKVESVTRRGSTL